MLVLRSSNRSITELEIDFCVHRLVADAFEYQHQFTDSDTSEELLKCFVDSCLNCTYSGFVYPLFQVNVALFCR